MTHKNTRDDKVVHYTSCRIIDGRSKRVVVDENGKIVDKSPSKDKLKGLKDEKYKVNRKRKYIDKELLDCLRQFYKENGRVPIWDDFNNNHKYPSFGTYSVRFGSWNRALKLAGLCVNHHTGLADKELLDCLRQFHKEHGRIPVMTDFDNSIIYPHYSTYVKRFGNWSKALKLVGLDIEMMIGQGVLETNRQKGRLAEVLVRDHFKKSPTDLSGNNQNSSCDRICPNGKMYDVKSSKLYIGGYWSFRTDNKYKEEIEIYYFLSFNEDYTKIMYVWRVPGEIIEKDHFNVGLNRDYEFNIWNLKEYDITDKFREILVKYGFIK